MNWPVSKVHLWTVPTTTQARRRTPLDNAHNDNDDDNDDSKALLPVQLQEGRLYKVPIPDYKYEDYHQTAEDLTLGLGGNACGCSCEHCMRGCHGDGGPSHTTGGGGGLHPSLPTNYYVLTVPDDLYQRVVDEICQARTMPCGFFYCGHYEDVDRPSIQIAIGLVTMLLTAMAVAAYLVRNV